MDNLGIPRRWALVSAVVLAACGSGGPGDQQQGRSRSFSEPPPASNLEERAARGLAISPVPIHTDGLSAEDKLKVGIGSYIVNGPGLCIGCHNSDAGYLAGGNPFALGGGQMVFARNLTPDPDTGMQLNEWQFLDTLRTGRDRHAPGDKMLMVMPWLYFRWMSEADLHAIYAYLSRIPPVKNAIPPDVKEALPVPPSLPAPTLYTDGEADRELHYNGDYLPPLRGMNTAPRVLPQDLGGASFDSVAPAPIWSMPSRIAPIATPIRPAPPTNARSTPTPISRVAPSSACRRRCNPSSTRCGACRQTSRVSSTASSMSPAIRSRASAA